MEVFKSCQNLLEFLDVNFEQCRSGQRGQRVLDVVPPRQRKMKLGVPTRSDESKLALSMRPRAYLHRSEDCTLAESIAHHPARETLCECADPGVVVIEDGGRLRSV